MPPGIALDGEFWAGRECFEKCGIFRRKVPDTQEWIDREVVYKVFDLPSSKKPFEERMADLKQIVEERCSCQVTLNLPDAIVTVRCPLEYTEHIKAKSEAQVDQVFKDIIKKGGEGIMLRQPGSFYEQKRSGTLRKVKAAFDTECEIVGYKMGTGKYEGLLGSFECQLLDKKDEPMDKNFYVSGMNDQTREDYETTHPIGTIITITYNDVSTSGVPRHPRYLRKPDDVGL
jgi:DNA ligase-1